MERRRTLSLGLRSDTFYDGTERICSYLKATETKIAFVAKETLKLENQKVELQRAMLFREAEATVAAEAKALRHNATALIRLLHWWKQFGSAAEQECAQRLLNVAAKYGTPQQLSVRDCRTAVEMLLIDLGTEQSVADLAALNGLQAIVNQLEASLATLREKQATVDAAKAATVKPESLYELKRGIANTVNVIMDYLVSMSRVRPKAYSTLLDQLFIIIDDANARKRKASKTVDAATANDSADAEVSA